VTATRNDLPLHVGICHALQPNTELYYSRKRRLITRPKSAPIFGPTSMILREVLRENKPKNQIGRDQNISNNSIERNL